ncbi:MAG: hypothetical protein LBK06_10135 [Planctomycetaceae bacterium]|nr:hypothetical protein [Planctomycetaceae bacterium]
MRNLRESTNQTVNMKGRDKIKKYYHYAKAVLKFAKLNTVAQQREAVTRGRSLLPYRLRYKNFLR